LPSLDQAERDRVHGSSSRAPISQRIQEEVMDTSYVVPGRSTRMFNAAVARLTKLGISVWGSRVLYVRGRSTGEWRSTPVNPLTFNGERYLVAPRGTTQWVRNLRAADGHGELHLGR